MRALVLNNHINATSISVSAKYFLKARHIRLRTKPGSSNHHIAHVSPRDEHSALPFMMFYFLFYTKSYRARYLGKIVAKKDGQCPHTHRSKKVVFTVGGVGSASSTFHASKASHRRIALLTLIAHGLQTKAPGASGTQPNPFSSALLLIALKLNTTAGVHPCRQTTHTLPGIRRRQFGSCTVCVVREERLLSTSFSLPTKRKKCDRFCAVGQVERKKTLAVALEVCYEQR
jgi:hypothetical protein